MPRGAVGKVLSAAMVSGLALGGCGSSSSGLRCGAGTVEVNGACVAMQMAGSAGSAANDAGAGSGGACPNPAVVSEPLIEDFEAGATRWRTSADTTGVVMGTGTASGPPESNSGELNDGASAAHFHGSGFSDWGATLYFAGWEVDCADLSAFSGVSFAARGAAGTGDTLASTLEIQIVLPSTSPVEFGGDCIESCYDHYKTRVTLAESWQSFHLPWANLAQAGWGARVPFTPERILGLNFQVLSSPEGTDFDWWFDDVALETD